MKLSGLNEYRQFFGGVLLQRGAENVDRRVEGFVYFI